MFYFILPPTPKFVQKLHLSMRQKPDKVGQCIKKAQMICSVWQRDELCSDNGLNVVYGTDKRIHTSL